MLVLEVLKGVFLTSKVNSFLKKKFFFNLGIVDLD